MSVSPRATTSQPQPKIRFAPDSALEGDGFEPSVPHKKQPFLAAPISVPQFAFRNKNRLFRAGDRCFESISLQRRVSLTGVFGGSRRKSPAFAGSVSLDVTRERDA